MARPDQPPGRENGPDANPGRFPVATSPPPSQQTEGSAGILRPAADGGPDLAGHAAALAAALDEIDAALAGLHQERARIVDQLLDAGAAAARRVDALLAQRETT